MPTSLFWSQDACVEAITEKGDGAISTEIGERTLMRREPGGTPGDLPSPAGEATSANNSADCRNKELTRIY
jgi:hypothetical protein